MSTLLSALSNISIRWSSRSAMSKPCAALHVDVPNALPVEIRVSAYDQKYMCGKTH